ncbi:MAG: extensin family protein [Parasphingorhabdus sp.]
MAGRRKRRSYFNSTKRIATFLATFFVTLVILLLAYSEILKDRPQDLPWTELDLNQPIGYFTGRKLAALDGRYQQCRQLLDAANIQYSRFPPTGRDQCQRNQNVNLLFSKAGRIKFSPARLAPSCPVAAALTIWEDQVVQPAARQLFGHEVTHIQHLGSFSCRPIAGTDRWSEHATANAIDIAGFTLADGERISLIKDWEGNDPKARFLRLVRDGSCDLFSTVLSPDYNSAHADHFHLDQAQRGVLGNRLCR